MIHGRLDSFERRSYASSRFDVVIFDHDSIVEAETVVDPATDFDGPLVKDAIQRRCLPSIQQSGLRSDGTNLVHHCPGGRGDSRHSLHYIERQALS